MKLAMIPPISMLSDVISDTYHLLLPHLFEDQRYAEFYKFDFWSDRGDFVILDNGAAENALADWDTIVTYATRLAVDEVVIPDELGDAKKTLMWADKYFFEASWPYEFDPMIVVQGRDENECKYFIDEVLDRSEYVTLGIPRHLLKRTGYKSIRIELADYAKGSGHKGPLHALGASNYWPNEIYDLAITGMFRGMDTSMPYMYGLQLVEWPHEPFDSGTAPNRADDYFTCTPTDMQWACAVGNARNMRRAVNGE